MRMVSAFPWGVALGLVASAPGFGCSSKDSNGATASDAGAKVSVGATMNTGSDAGTPIAIGGASHDAGDDGAGDQTRDAGDGSDAAPLPTCTTPLPSSTTAPGTIDPTCYTSTFSDDFSAYDISSGTLDDGMHPSERWFNGTDQCCMQPSNGWPGVMYPTPSQANNLPVNPYSLLPGGGLNIALTEANNEWFSGIITSVDGNENGFSQTYGYFEMNTQLPPGTGTFPSFWMLSLPRNVAGGEIDVFEQLGCSPPLNPAVEKIFHFTLHDWVHNTTPFAYMAEDNLPDLTAAYHRYGLLWNQSYMAVYLDDVLIASTTTPAVMINTKYFLLADLGVGGGWDTTQTANPSNMRIKWIRAYSVPGF